MVNNSSSKDKKRSLILILIGNFLEHFDLMLYVHTAVVLNELFFPKTITAQNFYWRHLVFHPFIFNVSFIFGTSRILISIIVTYYCWWIDKYTGLLGISILTGCAALIAFKAITYFTNAQQSVQKDTT